jgi:hypothetical protein
MPVGRESDRHSVAVQDPPSRTSDARDEEREYDQARPPYCRLEVVFARCDATLVLLQL